MDRLCKISKCGLSVKARGWCVKHYDRWRMHGDPTKTVKTPPGEAQKFLDRAVSSNTSHCIVWPYNKAKGYGQIFNRKTKKMDTVPRVVLQRCVGPAPSSFHEACHLPSVCHNRACINPKHLRWATRKENMRDKLIDGTDNRGQRCSKSILTEKQVLNIYSDPRICRVIAKEYDVGRQTVNSIKLGKNWAWLTSPAASQKQGT